MWYFKRFWRIWKTYQCISHPNKDDKNDVEAWDNIILASGCCNHHNSCWLDLFLIVLGQNYRQKNGNLSLYPPKEIHPEDIFQNIILQSKKVVFRPWCQNMFYSTIKIKLACKIWVLYLNKHKLCVIVTSHETQTF